MVLCRQRYAKKKAKISVFLGEESYFVSEIGRLLDEELV